MLVGGPVSFLPRFSGGRRNLDRCSRPELFPSLLWYGLVIPHFARKSSKKIAAAGGGEARVVRSISLEASEIREETER
jgi:hypothetical protein